MVLSDQPKRSAQSASNRSIHLDISVKWFRTAAAAFLALAGLYIVAFAARFHANPLSDSPTDWTDFAGMVGALVAPALSLWSVALVLQSLRLQQEQLAEQQYQFQITRDAENALLDPHIVEARRENTVHDEHPLGLGFVVFFQPEPISLMTLPLQPTDAVIPARRRPDGGWEVLMWKAVTHGNFHASVSYTRRNGSTGQNKINVVDAFGKAAVLADH